MDRYSDTASLIRQITKQHQKLDCAWNCINDHSKVAVIPYQNKEEFSQQFTISFLAQLKVKA